MAMGPMRRISRVKTTKKMVMDIWKLIEALPCSLTKSESALPVIQTITGPMMLPNGTRNPPKAMR